jgi:hypothetical protein
VHAGDVAMDQANAIMVSIFLKAHRAAKRRVVDFQYFEPLQILETIR